MYAVSSSDYVPVWNNAQGIGIFAYDSAYNGVLWFASIGPTPGLITGTPTGQWSMTNNPAVSSAVAGTKSSTGWYTSAATISFTPIGLPTPTTSGCGTVAVSDTTGKTYTCTVTNSAGSANAVIAIKQDTVPPVVSVTTPTNGAIYKLNSKVTAAYSCSDATSGVATCVGSSANGTALTTSKAGTYVFSITGTDKAGNKTAKSISYTVR
jgi:hypothetical protein